VNTGAKRVDVPRLPSMSLQGYIQAKGRPPAAVVEMKELNRVFVVRVGTEIPVTIPGRLTPLGRAELTGLAPPGSAGSQPVRPVVNSGEQTQVILKVTKISPDGVVVEAGLLAQTIFIR
jgi:hypothetical protein